MRELRNLIERAMILARDEESLTLDLLPAELFGAGTDDDSTGALAQSEARLIREALREAGGNQSRAAAQLGISRGALARKLKRLKIEPESPAE